LLEVRRKPIGSNEAKQAVDTPGSSRETWS
jgi:hypothetical protein